MCMHAVLWGTGALTHEWDEGFFFYIWIGSDLDYVMLHDQEPYCLIAYKHWAHLRKSTWTRKGQTSDSCTSLLGQHSPGAQQDCLTLTASVVWQYVQCNTEIVFTQPKIWKHRSRFILPFDPLCPFHLSVPVRKTSC